MNNKNYNIYYDKPITSWDEALPLGNGKMGCLLYGDGPIRMSLDRVDLWDTRPHPVTLEEGFCYKNLVALSTSCKKEDWVERDRLFEDIYSEFPYPSKITAGRLELDFGAKAKNICSEVDIHRAVGNLSFEGGSIEVYMHATRFIGVAKVCGDYELKIHIPKYISGQEYEDLQKANEGGVIVPVTGMGYPQADVVTDGEFTYYRQETKSDLSYGIIVYRVPKTDYTELYFTIETNADGEDFIESAKDKLREISKMEYKALLAEHVAWWDKYWNESKISIDDELLERTYYLSWYLFGSCSRKGYYPMPLQGVWTADNDCIPPWRGDYHNDTNTQMSYQAYLKANRLEEGEAFIDYLWQYKSQFEKFAKEFYGVEGILIPGVSTLDGKPMGGWAHYSLSPTMSIWSAQSFDEYYLYTGDEEFLRERAFPFMDGVASAIKGLLREENGKLYLPISSSPEIHNAEPEAYLKPNSNCDLALMRYLFERLIDYCSILNKDAGLYQSVLDKLDDIAIIDGYISLDREERLKESHRHFSHLMCLYPLHLINYDSEEHRKLYYNAIKEIERLGTGNWVGFSFAMSAQIYAMAENGNAAYERERQYADGFVAENGFHLNGDFKRKGYSSFHYRPFTLESSYGFCDALQEMLLQEHQGYLHLFPAIPDDWKKKEISFEKLRSYGGVLVSAKAEKGQLAEVSLEVQRPMRIRMKNTFGTNVILVQSNGISETKMDNSGFFELNLPTGQINICPVK